MTTQRAPRTRVSEETILQLFRLFEGGSNATEAARSLGMVGRAADDYLAYYDHVRPMTWKIARRLMPEARRLLAERGKALGRRYEPDVAEVARRHVPMLISGEPVPPPPTRVGGRLVGSDQILEMFRRFAAGQGDRHIGSALVVPHPTVNGWRHTYDHREPVSGKRARRLVAEAVSLLHARGAVLGRRYEPDVTVRARRHVPVAQDGSPGVPVRLLPAPSETAARTVKVQVPVAADAVNGTGPARKLATVVIEISISVRSGEGIELR